MADRKPTAQQRKTSRPHKPTRKAQESAKRTKRAAPPSTLTPPEPSEGKMPPKSPDGMTLEEFVEHIDAPRMEYLEQAANDGEQPTPSAWEQHR